VAQRIELAREMVANAGRLFTPNLVPPDGMTTPITAHLPIPNLSPNPNPNPRFELQDLQSTPWSQQWLQQHPGIKSMTVGEDKQNAAALWALYLASPQFMYR